MKKTFIYLFSMLALMTFSACGHDDEPDQPDEIQSTELLYFSKTVRGNTITFLQNNGTIELNYTQGTIQLTCDYNDYKGQRHTMSTPKMKVILVSDHTYAFSDKESINTFDGSYPNGMINLDTGVVWFSFTNEYEQTIVTTYLNFPAPTSTITSLEDNRSYQHTGSSYLFAPQDAQGKTCVMQINNFIANLSGVVEDDLIQFQGLPMTPTTDGYTITADRAEATYGGHYTITDVNLIISSQCKAINGSFKYNGYKISIAGSMFP